MNRLQGVFTALVTPFKDNQIDFDSLEKLLRWQLDQGIQGFVLHGTTGESPTLTQSEKQKVFQFVQSYVSGQVPLIVGTGTNNTFETIEATRKARSWGANAALVVVPYYNKPPQRGLYQHFREVAEKSDFEILVYNVPGRTITSISVETLEQLSAIPQIIGIKEATGDIELMKSMKEKTRRNFIFLSGDDGTYGEFLKAGGHGVISVASHILPRAMVEWTNWAHRSEWHKIDEATPQFKKIIDQLFVEANPIPVKMALFKMGILSSPELRLPLIELKSELLPELIKEMKSSGVLK